MSEYLHYRNFPCASKAEEARLADQLESVITTDLRGNVFGMLGNFQRILADNRRRDEWDVIFNKLKILFLCGRDAVVDGPMIGVPVAIRDSDYFRHTAQLLGSDRSAVAAVEWMATCWNATFADTGLWMGKTFEPVSYETVAARCDHDPQVLKQYSPFTTRIGRNFFREPPNPDLIRKLGIPVLTKVWQLRRRPANVSSPGFLGQLVMATNHYSLGVLRTAFPGMKAEGWEIGEPYKPATAGLDYGYQNNGFFLMIDPEFAHEAYADDAFPHLRPRQGESGYIELGYDRIEAAPAA